MIKGPTIQELREFAPTGKRATLEGLASPQGHAELRAAGLLDNPLRLCHFLGQCYAETGGLRLLTEGGSYSAKRLRQIFPKYFTESQARAYARKPQKILSRAYANRLGNGSEASGDGWRYRGHGLIQRTGKEKFTAYSPSETIDPIIGIRAAGDYWNRVGINKWADKNNLLAVSKGVNLGNPKSRHRPNGLDERRAGFNRGWRIWGDSKQLDVDKPKPLVKSKSAWSTVVQTATAATATAEATGVTDLLGTAQGVVGKIEDGKAAIDSATDIVTTVAPAAGPSWVLFGCIVVGLLAVAGFLLWDRRRRGQEYVF